MKISVYGAGYVGLVQASCLATLGHDVVCAELLAHRLDALAKGKTPFYEPGMDDLLMQELAKGRLRFTSDPADAARHGEVQFLAVGTPPLENGSSDLSYLLAAADTIAMLAVRISFMNELANLADATGACIDSVREAMSLDDRVGKKFLNSGCGYGGSCFPKDVTSLVKQGEAAGSPMRIADAAAQINVRQRELMADQLIDMMQKEGRKAVDTVIALWGLAFKPDTDDVREAPAIVMAKKLLIAGFTVRAFDPQAEHSGHAELASFTQFSTAPTAMDALSGADALLVATEWSEFVAVNPADVAKAMRTPIVFDGRSVFNVAAARAAGIRYQAFGRAHA